MNKQILTILGATGSIGLSTLDVVSRHPESYELFAVTGNTNVDGLFDICQQHEPKYAVLVDECCAHQLETKLKEISAATKVLAGAEGLEYVSGHKDVTTVMAAIVGGAGLTPTLTAAQNGKRILLANKESLVMSGDLFLQTVQKNGASLLPVDSEHNAIFQSMPLSVQQGGELKHAGVRQILLTGSGGPFLTKPINEFIGITPEMAVAHPNWSMGAKISVDSATMMNKGLEFIEARLLFNASYEQIKVVVHPQSIIHSMVSYVDGSVIAQMGRPDMRTPIAHCLAYPERIDAGVEPLDFDDIVNFSFVAPDFERFPNLALALEASKSGQGATTVLNASNEIAVAAFLERKIAFNQIAEFNEKSLVALAHHLPQNISDILELDKQTREYVLANLPL